MKSIQRLLHNPVIRVIVLLLLAGAAHAQKDDTVYLINGDKVTGELKKYESGILVLKTDGMSTLNIEYEKIRTFYSAKNCEIVFASGFNYYGSFLKSTTSGSVDIKITNDTLTESISDIVEIIPIKNRFWKKFYGSVDLGMSYYKSTKTLQYNFNSNINYRARKDLVSFDLGFQYSEQETPDTTIIARKNDIGLNLNHFFEGRWWGGIGAKLQQNTELDLAYRVQMGVGAGYDIVHTNPIRFYAMGGLLVNREKPTDSIDFTTNFEGIISTKFTWLQHRHPQIDISTNLDFFPSFSVKGRFRLEYNISAKYEILTDLYIGLTYYDDYDSKPSGGGPALNDWSLIFSVGYSF